MAAKSRETAHIIQSNMVGDTFSRTANYSTNFDDKKK